MIKRLKLAAPIIIAIVHGMLFAATVLYVYTSSTEQAALVWLYWAPIDFPFSLLYYAAPTYSQLVYRLVGDSPLTYVLYLPHLIHGLLGTVWWYFLALLTIKAVSRLRSMRRE